MNWCAVWGIRCGQKLDRESVGLKVCQARQPGVVHSAVELVNPPGANDAVGGVRTDCAQRALLWNLGLVVVFESRRLMR